MGLRIGTILGLDELLPGVLAAQVVPLKAVFHQVPISIAPLLENVFLCPGKIFVLDLAVVQEFKRALGISVDQQCHMFTGSCLVVVYRTGNEKSFCRRWHRVEMFLAFRGSVKLRGNIPEVAPKVQTPIRVRKLPYEGSGQKKQGNA